MCVCLCEHTHVYIQVTVFKGRSRGLVKLQEHAVHVPLVALCFYLKE